MECLLVITNPSLNNHDQYKNLHNYNVNKAVKNA